MTSISVAIAQALPNIMLSNLARWPEPNAGWRVGMRAEAYLALDFFGTFYLA
jgi:hypothetical protein